MDNYVKILMSSLVLSITQGMLFPQLPIYAYEIGGKFAYAGYIFSLPSIIMVVMTFGWGSISDRLGNRRVIIILSNVVASLLYFTFGYVTITWLVVLRCVQTFFYSSYILIPAIITEYFPSSKGRALGKYNVATGIGWTIGGILSGHTAASGFPFFFGSIGVLSFLFCATFFFIQDVPREKDMRKLKTFFIFGQSKKIVILCVYAFVIVTGGTMLSSIFNVYLSNVGVSKEYIGYVSSLTSLTFLLVADAVGKACDTVGRKPLLVVTPILYMGMWVGIGLLSNIYVKIILWILPIYALFITASTSAVSDMTSEKERGRGIGILNSFIGFGTFAGGVIGGNLADAVGVKNTFLSASLFAIMGILMSLKMEETKDA
jgi:MFS family permease